MAPESWNNEARAEVTAKHRFGKDIPAATNTQATMKELSFVCNSEVDTSV
jgi:hypothetical protein